MEANFAASELLVQVQQGSAIVKGLFALMKKAGCEDFVEGESVSDMVANGRKIEYHHVFPSAYCKDSSLSKRHWNAIVNKTPIIAKTNRQIGSKAPSLYLAEFIRKPDIDEDVLARRLHTHLIQFDHLYRKDNFKEFFEYRAKKILEMVESAMGKRVDGDLRYEDS